MPTVLQAVFFLLMCTTGLVEIVNIAGLIDADARHAGYVLYRALVSNSVKHEKISDR